MWHSAIAAIILSAVLASGAAADPVARAELWVKNGDTVIKAPGTARHRPKQEYRLVGFDAPGIANAKCPKEAEKGVRAAAALVELLDSGSIDLTQAPCPCRRGAIGRNCNFGRSCGRLTVDGNDVAGTMIAQGHAVAYHCSATRCPRQQSWCQ